MKKLMETVIPENYSKGLDAEKEFTLPAVHTDKIATVLFTAVSECLKGLKSKETPAVFKFIDIKGELIAAAIVEFHANEDDSKPGNWSYVWTFDVADIPDNATVVDITQPMTHSFFVSVAGKKFHMAYENDRSIVEVHNYLLQQISKWLQENANEAAEEGVELDGVFQARVAVEDGEVVKSIEVIGETKALIKSDEDIEVVE